MKIALVWSGMTSDPSDAASKPLSVPKICRFSTSTTRLFRRAITLSRSSTHEQAALRRNSRAARAD